MTDDRTARPRCMFCEKRHHVTYLCPPARQILDASIERGQSYDMPTVTFDEPMETRMTQPGDTAISQLTVAGAVIEVASVPRAALVLSGRNLDGAPLPRWVLVNTDEQIQATARLVARMADLAVTTAQGQR